MSTFVKFFVVGLSMVNAQFRPIDDCFLSEFPNHGNIGICLSNCDMGREIDLYGHSTENRLGSAFPCKCCSFADLCPPCESNCNPDFDSGANGCVSFAGYVLDVLGVDLDAP